MIQLSRAFLGFGLALLAFPAAMAADPHRDSVRYKLKEQLHASQTSEPNPSHTLKLPASATASPNRRLVSHADALLGRNGRMNRAIEAIGRGSAAMEAQAFSIPSTYLPASNA